MNISVMKYRRYFVGFTTMSSVMLLSFFAAYNFDYHQSGLIHTRGIENKIENEPKMVNSNTSTITVPSMTTNTSIMVSDQESREVKTILFWNSFYKVRHFGAGALGRAAFINNNCSINRCELVTDRGLLKEASAVVFHMRGRMDNFPKHVNERQMFVYFLRESPHHTGGNSRRYQDRFNLTMTYRQDSDLPVPIYKFVPVQQPSETTYKLKYPFQNKKKHIAWLVSHCGTPSRRAQYTKALSKYIDVDIYGACGRHKCPRGKDCMAIFEADYKFYLSFENSYCTDYVTEKYFRTLDYDMIPIVYGRANYSAIGPPQAFINILDYRSPKHLADYLHYLATNETAYLEYFQTRPFWKSVPVRGPAFCDLCALVHNKTFKRTYKDVHKWWSEDMCDLETVNKVMATTKT